MSRGVPGSDNAIDVGWPEGSAIGFESGAGEEPLLVDRVVRASLPSLGVADAAASSAYCWSTGLPQIVVSG